MIPVSLESNARTLKILEAVKNRAISLTCFTWTEVKLHVDSQLDGENTVATALGIRRIGQEKQKGERESAIERTRLQPSTWTIVDDWGCYFFTGTFLSRHLHWSTSLWTRHPQKGYSPTVQLKRKNGKKCGQKVSSAYNRWNLAKGREERWKEKRKAKEWKCPRKAQKRGPGRESVCVTVCLCALVCAQGVRGSEKEWKRKWDNCERRWHIH